VSGEIMTPFELSILAYESTAAIDSIFESWMAITFAFIVASYAAGSRISFSIKIFVSILYLSCAALLFFRYISFANQTFHYFAELGKYDARTITDSYAKTLGLVRRLVFIGGTFGSIFFLFVSTKNSDEKL
jgi:hypothetical protein